MIARTNRCQTGKIPIKQKGPRMNAGAFSVFETGDCISVSGSHCRRGLAGFLTQGCQLQGSLLMQDETGTRRDEMPEDDILLQANQINHLTGQSRFSEHLGGLLERGGGDEALGLDRSLGDTKKQR